MKGKATIVLALAFGALLGYYLLFERHAKTSEEAASEAKRVFRFEEKEVSALRIVRPDSTVRLERHGADRWTLAEPVRARADRWAMSEAVRALATLEQSRFVRNERGPQGLEEMGLAKPRARIEIALAGAFAPASAPESGTTSASRRDASSGRGVPTGSPAGGSTAVPEHREKNAPKSTETAGGGERSDIVAEIGAEVPATSSMFFRIAGHDDILLVPSSAAAPFLKPADDYRDRALLDTTLLDIGEARVTRPEGDLRFRRREGEWWVEEPVEDLAAGERVQSLLSTIIGLRAEKFLDAGTAAGVTFQRTVRLFDTTGADIATVRLGGAVPGEEGRSYAGVEGPAGTLSLATVGSAGLEALAGAAVEFRSRKALPFRTWDADALNLSSPSVTLSFGRKEGVWTASSPASLAVDQAAIETTLRTVSELDISELDAAKGRSLSALDLDPPRTRIEVRIEAEAGKTKTLVLGSQASPGAVYARAEGRPGVFTVPSGVLERIAGGAALYGKKQDAKKP